MMADAKPSLLHMEWLSDYFWIFLLYAIARIRACGFRQSMIPRQLTAQSQFCDSPRHPKLSSAKVKLPPSLTSPSCLFKTGAINVDARQGSLHLPSKVKSNPPSIGNYATSDLVNILASPGYASQTSFPWTCIPLSSLRAITDCLKHILWIFTRPVAWHYPVQSREDILDSETMLSAYEKAAQQELLSSDSSEFSERASRVDRSRYLREAKEILIQMASSTSVLLIRVAAVVVNKIFGHSLSGIYARRCQLSQLQLLEEANPDAPIVYLPLHRSHLDYILLTYMLYIRGMRAPQVAAGDNLNIPVFGRLLRGLGGFFIRRKIDQKTSSRNSSESESKDFIYRGVLQQFICEVVSQGYPLEFYLEGGRSRNGRTLRAKAGLLSVLIHAYQKGFIQDAIIVPVAFTYDRLIEGNFVPEQCGSQKTKESFGHALRSIWRTIRAHFGTVRIEFGNSFTLKRFLLENAERFGLDPSDDFGHSGCLLENDEDLTLGTSCSSASLISVLPPDDNTMSRLIMDLASVVLREANRCLALSAPNLVFFLMSTKFRKGCRESDLIAAMSDLCVDLTSPSKRKMLTFDDFNGDNLRQLCRYSASVHPHLISIADGRYNVCSSMEKVIERHYYSGPVMEALVGESVLAASLSVQLQGIGISLVGEEELNPTDSEIDWEAVEQGAHELCVILENEFIQFQPASESKSVIERAKQSLVDWGMLRFRAIPDSSVERAYVRCDRQALQRISDLKASIAPLVEGYSAVANDLAHIFDSTHNFCDHCLQHELLSRMQWKAARGCFEYTEGCAKDTMLNCLKRLRSSGILETKKGVSGSRPGPQNQYSLNDGVCGAQYCRVKKSSVPLQLSQIAPGRAEDLVTLKAKLEKLKAPLIIV